MCEYLHSAETMQYSINSFSSFLGKLIMSLNDFQKLWNLPWYAFSLNEHSAS